MAESTLSVTYADLKESVAHYLGYGRTSGNWTTRQTTNINDSVNRGLNEFYNHAMTPGMAVPHKWSFLNPRAEFIVWPTTTTAAITVSGGGNTILTAASGTPFYPSMEKKTIVANSAAGSTWVSAGNSYTIDSYTSATVVNTTADASADNGRIFRVTADGDYTLPQDFQAIEGPLTYTTSTAPWVPIPMSGEAEIRQLRSVQSTGGIPLWAAIDPVPYDSSSAQRWQVMLFPTPSVIYTLLMRYTRAPNALSSDTDYPPGGTQYTECVRLMCEAAAEKEVRGERGPKYADSREALARAIMADSMNNSPEYLGPMVDFESPDNSDLYYERRWSGQNITTNF